MKITLRDLDHRDSYKLLMGTVVPRPIALVSTIGADGIFNLAPFSAFTTLGVKPAIVCFCVASKRDGKKKDTLANIEYSRDFVINVVTEELAEAMNLTSTGFPSNVDEFKEAGLTPLGCDLVKAPRLAESPVNMECQFLQVLEFGQKPQHSTVVIGEVLLVHIGDDVYRDGEIQLPRLKVVGRLGGNAYCRTTDIFEMIRPPSSYE
jgi:flavin reductase (DIM6/NTAB) family NADH-FMN oxidoreductase RutF